VRNVNKILYHSIEFPVRVLATPSIVHWLSSS